MPQADITQNAFLGGEIHESLQGRVENPIFKYGVSEAINVDITPQGSLIKRNGMKYVWSSDDPSLTSVRWIPYRIADGRTLLFLVTPTKFIAFLEGALTVGPNGVSPAEVDTNGWSEHTQLNPQTNIRYVQIGDSIYLCRPTHPTVRLKINFNADGELLLEWNIVRFRSGQEPRLRRDLEAFGPETSFLGFSFKDKSIVTLDAVQDSLNTKFIRSVANLNIIDTIGSSATGGRSIAASALYKENIILLVRNHTAGNPPGFQNYSLLQLSLVVNDYTIVKLRDIHHTIDGVSMQGSSINANINFVGDELYINSGTNLFKFDLTSTDNTQGEHITSLTGIQSSTCFYFDNRFWYFTSFSANNNLRSFRLDSPDTKVTNTWLFRTQGTGFSEPSASSIVSTNGENLYLYDPVSRLLFQFDIFATSSSFRVLKDLSDIGEFDLTRDRRGNSRIVVYDQNQSENKITKLDLENFGFSAISYYQGRLALSGHPQIPNAVFLSDVNKFNVFTDSSDLGADQILDSDALFLQIAQGPDSGVHSLKSWQDRLIMNSVWGVYQLKPPFNTTTGSVTPTSFEVRFSSQIGASFEVDSVLTEEGLIYPDNNGTAIFRYDYKDESDIYSATAISNTLKGINDKKIIGLEYTSGATSILLVDSIAKNINTSINREEVAIDLRNLKRIIYDESEGQLATSEYRLPEEWVGLGSFYPVGNSIYFSMIGRPAGAPAGRDRFIVGYIDDNEDTEFDFSITHRTTNTFTRINTGLGWLGTGTEVILKDRINREIHRGTITAGGGFSGTFNPTTWVEVGLGFTARIKSNDLTVQATRTHPTNFSNISQVTHSQVLLNNKTDYYVYNSNNIKSGTENSGQDLLPSLKENDQRISFPTAKNISYWSAKQGIPDKVSRHPKIIIEIGEENKMELLAIKIILNLNFEQIPG